MNIKELQIILEEDFRAHGFEAEQCEKQAKVVIDFFNLLQTIGLREDIFID